MTSLIYTLILSLIAPLMAGKDADNGGMTASEAFINAPAARFPLVTKMKRMDMVDYFNSGMDRESDNVLGGKTRILELTPDKITVEEIGEKVSLTSISLDKMGRDTVMIVTSNLATPATDGYISFYSTDWKKLNAALFSEPSLKDWIVAKPDIAQDDIENMVPFVMAEYSYDPSTHILTLRASFKDYLPEEDYNKVKSSLKSELRYKWNGRKMVRIK